MTGGTGELGRATTEDKVMKEESLKKHRKADAESGAGADRQREVEAQRQKDREASGATCLSS